MRQVRISRAKNASSASAIPAGFSTWRRCVAPSSSNGSARGSHSSSRSRRSRKTANAVLADEGQRRLGDAQRVRGTERPLHDGRELLAEERVGIGHGLLDRARERALERLSVSGAADAAHPDIDGTRLSRKS